MLRILMLISNTLSVTPPFAETSSVEPSPAEYSPVEPSPAEPSLAEPLSAKPHLPLQNVHLRNLPCWIFPAKLFLQKLPSSAEHSSAILLLRKLPLHNLENTETQFSIHGHRTIRARVRLAPMRHGFPGQRQQFRRQSPDFNSWTQ